MKTPDNAEGAKEATVQEMGGFTKNALKNVVSFFSSKGDAEKDDE